MGYKKNEVGAWGTDPTYKEWKLRCIFNLRFFEECTDPTYKEWKPLWGEDTPMFRRRTDPTYKEWKLDRQSRCVKQ